jgi:hypothetical protein
MINAGALVAANLVGGETPEEQVDRVSAVFSAYAGRELARIYEAHGDLLFAGAEWVVHEIGDAGAELELLALAVRRVGEVAAVSRRMLVNMRAHLRDQGCEVFVIDPDGVLGSPREVDDEPVAFPTIAAATTFFEDRLLERYGEEEAFVFDEHPRWRVCRPGSSMPSGSDSSRAPTPMAS